MEIHGSKTTYNLENVLRQNILASDYFKETCMNLTSFEEVVDEIFLNVKHVEPWMSGNARGASTAFCLLYRYVQNDTSGVCMVSAGCFCSDCIQNRYKSC